jgi:hypothetical protein
MTSKNSEDLSRKPKQLFENGQMENFEYGEKRLDDRTMNVSQKELNTPRTKSQKVCVCYGLTADMEFAAGVSILNFVDLHGSEGFDFILYSDSELPRLVASLSSKGISVSVNIFRPPISWLDLYSSRAVSYFSPMVLSKFEIFNNLEKYSRVIWFDFDMVFQSKLELLLSADNFDLAFMSSQQTISSAFRQPPIGVDAETLMKEGFFAGLFVANDTFPDHKHVTKRLYELYLVHALNLYYPEQAIFDVFLEQTSYNRLVLNPRVYCGDPDDQSDEILVLHSWGPKKFWSGRTNLRWSSYYKEWRSIGGSLYRPFLIFANGISRRVQHALALVVLRFAPKRNP